MLNEIRLFMSEFLNIVIIDKPYFFLNFWSIWHLITGFIIMLIIIKFILFKKDSIILSKWGVLIIVLFANEIIELLFIASGSTLFRPEIPLDIIGDLVFGFLGGLLANHFLSS